MSARARIVWRSSADVQVPVPPAPEPRTPWWRHVYRDYRRYQMSGESRIATAFSQGFWASAAYRVSRAARPVPFFSAIAQKIVELVTSISLPAECVVGEGLWLSACGSIVIDGACRLGHNCTIAHGVTLEAAGRGEARGAPVIEDRVFIGAHAILIGKIT